MLHQLDRQEKQPQHQKHAQKADDGRQKSLGHQRQRSQISGGAFRAAVGRWYGSITTVALYKAGVSLMWT